MFKCIAKEWISGFLSDNCFGDDYTPEELDEWADDLLETFGLNNHPFGQVH